MTVPYQPSIKKILIDNTDKILSHYRDDIPVMYRKDIVDLLDKMIINIRTFGRYADNDDMLFIPHKIIEELTQIFQTRNRVSNPRADKTTLNNGVAIKYRNIPIYPYDNEYDEVYLLSAQAFLPKSFVDTWWEDGGAFTINHYDQIDFSYNVLLNKYNLVVRGTTWEFLTKKLTDKELKLKRFERDSSDIPQEIILWELRNRGII